MNLSEALIRDFSWIENLSRLCALKISPVDQNLSSATKSYVPAKWSQNTFRPFILLCIYHMTASSKVVFNQARNNGRDLAYDQLMAAYAESVIDLGLSELQFKMALDLRKRSDHWSTQSRIADFLSQEICPTLSASNGSAISAFDYSDVVADPEDAFPGFGRDTVYGFLSFQTPVLDRNLRLGECHADHFNGLSLVARSMVKVLKMATGPALSADASLLSEDIRSIFSEYPSSLGTLVSSTWNFGRLIEILQEEAEQA